MTPWINVNDELPDDMQTVLIANPNAPAEPVWLGYHDAGTWYEVDAWETHVTHWMHLPEPPVNEQ